MVCIAIDHVDFQNHLNLESFSAKSFNYGSEGTGDGGGCGGAAGGCRVYMKFRMGVAKKQKNQRIAKQIKRF